MIQIEIDKHTVQLGKALQLKKELAQIRLHKKNNITTTGSFVVTNQGDYFLSIGIGKVIIEGEVVYAISIASPIGKLLHNKRIGDRFVFQAKKYIIEVIV